MSFFAPSNCQVCGSGFGRNRYRWKIENRKIWVCAKCNTRLSDRVSAAAFGKPLELPEIKDPRGGFGCGRVLLLGAVAIAAVSILIIVLAIAFAGSSPNQPIREQKAPPKPKTAPALEPETSSVTKPEKKLRESEPSKTTAVQVIAPALSAVPLFRDPSSAAKVPLGLGLTDISPGKPPWRNSEIGWYGQSQIVTFKGGFSKVGDVDNNITCMHSSETPDRVDYVRWTANVFNTADTTTLSKFKELCLAYSAKLGCDVPADLFVGVDPSKGQLLETEQAIFKLEHLKYKLGSGWQFTVTAK